MQHAVSGSHMTALQLYTLKTRSTAQQARQTSRVNATKFDAAWHDDFMDFQDFRRYNEKLQNPACSSASQHVYASTSVSVWLNTQPFACNHAA
jgi:hypothetical protein